MTVENSSVLFETIAWYFTFGPRNSLLDCKCIGNCKLFRPSGWLATIPLTKGERLDSKGRFTRHYLSARQYQRANRTSCILTPDSQPIRENEKSTRFRKSVEAGLHATICRLDSIGAWIARVFRHPILRILIDVAFSLRMSARRDKNLWHRIGLIFIFKNRLWMECQNTRAIRVPILSGRQIGSNRSQQRLVKFMLWLCQANISGWQIVACNPPLWFWEGGRRPRISTNSQTFEPTQCSSHLSLSCFLFQSKTDTNFESRFELFGVCVEWPLIWPCYWEVCLAVRFRISDTVHGQQG